MDNLAAAAGLGLLDEARKMLANASSLDRHRSLGRRAEFLALGFDPEFHRPPAAHSDGTIPIVFVGSREPFRELALAVLSRRAAGLAAGRGVLRDAGAAAR